MFGSPTGEPHRGSIMANSLRARVNRYVAAAAARPDMVAALASQALAFHRAGRLTEAITTYKQILALRPSLPQIHNNLGLALAASGDLEEAVEAFRRAARIKPDDPETLCNFGFALAQLERYGEAESTFRRALAVCPTFAAAYNNLGLILKETGRLDEARRALEQAIRLAPKEASYYDNLAAIRPFAAGDPYVAALEAMTKVAASLSAVNRMHAHFALAKAYEDTGRPDSAFAQLLAGNALKRAQISYDEATTLRQMERARSLFTREFISDRAGSGEPSAVPVFIVGMPRSGTTLIEQILASHPEVFGAGELSLFEQSVDLVRSTLPLAPPFPQLTANMSAGHFRSLGARYLAQAAARAPQAARITDKMPANFMYVGLIHMALPNAAIIHAMRDPLDTCVSSFAVHFSKAQAHTYDLGELGRYHRHYQALMAHWREVLPPGRMLDVRYEELVSDPQGVARRIVGHCGLAWDARCLDFHRTQRAVRTASAAQVRRPIYQTSVGRWRKYQKYLAPLFAELAAATA